MNLLLSARIIPVLLAVFASMASSACRGHGPKPNTLQDFTLPGPKTAAQLPSEEAKRNEFERYNFKLDASCSGGRMWRGQPYFVTTESEKGGVCFEEGDVSPVIQDVSPAASSDLSTAGTWGAVNRLAMPIGLAGFLIWAAVDKNETSAIPLFVGLGAGMVAQQVSEHYTNEAVTQYHRDLRSRVFGGRETSRAKPDFSFGWAIELE
jgi:hypothetical protein